jgi:hypothetical protein
MPRQRGLCRTSIATLERRLGVDELVTLRASVHARDQECSGSSWKRAARNNFNRIRAILFVFVQFDANPALTKLVEQAGGEFDGTETAKVTGSDGDTFDDHGVQRRRRVTGE